MIVLLFLQVQKKVKKKLKIKIVLQEIIFKLKNMSFTYTFEEIKKKNREWRNSRIRMPYKNDKILYKIYATGDADLDGRYYIASPISLDINNYVIRRKYNLM